MNGGIYEDEIFQDLLLACNHLDLSNPFYVSIDDSAFLLNEDIVILIPRNKDDNSFQIIDLKRKNGLHDPFEEILVDYNQLSIKFYGKAGRDKKKLLISATYDNDEELWDVKSYVKGNEKPSTLVDALDELLLLDGGVEQRDSFISIICLCHNLAKNNKNQNSKDVKTKSLKN